MFFRNIEPNLQSFMVYKLRIISCAPTSLLKAKGHDGHEVQDDNKEATKVEIKFFKSQKLSIQQHYLKIISV
jgi:hypothetical protein